MDQYFKTDLGIQALKQRTVQLNARQRQLLLLIGTDDYEILNSGLKQRLATPELIQQLEQLGLIFQNKAHRSSNHKTEIALPVQSSIQNQIKTEQLKIESEKTQQITQMPFVNIDHFTNNDLIENLPATITQEHFTNESQISNISVSEKRIENTNKNSTTQNTESNQHELVCIAFDEIKQKMMNLLQNHCGLLAKQLILKIQNATSVRDIKLCQMQWITALQESRISPFELNQTMQQINLSLQHLQSS